MKTMYKSFLWAMLMFFAIASFDLDAKPVTRQRAAVMQAEREGRFSPGLAHAIAASCGFAGGFVIGFIVTPVAVVLTPFCRIMPLYGLMVGLFAGSVISVGLEAIVFAFTEHKIYEWLNPEIDTKEAII